MKEQTLTTSGADVPVVADAGGKNTEQAELLQRALHILDRSVEKATSKVRLFQPSHTEWLTAWRELAGLTYGIMPDDPRLQPVLDALNHCDTAFLCGDWSSFLKAADEVRSACFPKL